MQQIKHAVAVFCTACICAEVVSQLFAAKGARQCIKTVAGLYILLSILQAGPALRLQAAGFTPPVLPQKNYGSLTDMVAQQTALQLQQTLQEQLYAQTGCEVLLTVTLAAKGGALHAQAVAARAAGALGDAQKSRVQAFILQQLGPVEVIWEEDTP